MGFKAGQIDGVREFVEESLPGLCQRISLDSEDSERLSLLFRQSLEVSTARMSSIGSVGLHESVQEGRELIEFIESRLLTDESVLSESEHLESIKSILDSGGNVLIIQNHTSGADTVIFRELARRAACDCVVNQCVWFAGHVVSHYLLPLTVMCGLRFVPIVSLKYKALAAQFGGDGLCSIQEQNICSMRTIRNLARQGGQLFGLYPEGGRGNGQMLEGDYRIAKILELIGGASPGNFFVLPTYIQGATSVLPVQRIGEAEFAEFLLWVRRGTAKVTCGEPIPWEDFCSSRSCSREERSMAIYSRAMRSIASLAPTEYARGPWR